MPDPSGSTDAFGTPTFKNGSGATLAGTTTGTRFLFTGREWLSQFGLYDYRNRTYSAAFGRFVEKDPIGFRAGDLNLYRYVFNNPINWTDPQGLDRTIHFAFHMWMEVDTWDECCEKTGKTTLSFQPDRLFFGATTDWSIGSSQTYPFSFSYTIKSGCEADKALLNAWQGQASLETNGIQWNVIANCWNITLGSSTWGNQ